MFKIIVLVSGSGTNMLQLIKNDIKIDCIIADRECKAKNIADEYKIDISMTKSPEEIQKLVLEREWNLLPRVVKELIKKSINN